MTSNGRLADYLKIRRERLQPEDVGLVAGPTRRRVPGLRREEVAVLAGISTDYYLRLEQGRDLRPSPQVLDALARALQLDDAATTYLHRLASPPNAPAAIDAGDVVSDSTVALINSWSSTAAVVHNRYIDCLTANSLATALNPNFRAGVNSVIALLSDPSEREFHVGWEGLASRSVAGLRLAADTYPDDTRLDDLVTQGAASSVLFRELWDRQDVGPIGSGVHVLRHPLVGEIVLNYQRLALADTDGQSLFTYFAEPGTPSAKAMEQLASAT